ncbi:hypothetical protein ACIPC1_25540 [Streptomyces sp. NPDC087263]|uniref:hypothetical protein n=1 Tax=Streptomyces sp. NPDC087263 TaxID=3365773 RepID=UPI0037F4A73D
MDAKWLADNVPVTGAKAEVSGAKAEANAGALNVFGVQAEYGLVKHEAAAIDLNKIFERKAQERVDNEQDRRLHGLTMRAVATQDLFGAVKRILDTATADIRRLQADEQRLTKRGTALQNAIGDIRRKLTADDQRLRTQLSALSARIGKVSQVANAADQRSKSVRIRTQEALKQVGVLDRAVRKGLQKISDLDEETTSTRGSVHRLDNALKSLEQTLRR